MIVQHEKIAIESRTYDKEKVEEQGGQFSLQQLIGQLALPQRGIKEYPEKIRKIAPEDVSEKRQY